MGAFVNVNESDDQAILVNIIVFNKDYIIKGEFFFKESNPEDNYANILVYKTENIAYKEIQFSGNKWRFNNVAFSNTLCKLSFYDGNELIINKNDFPDQQTEFMDIISFFAKL